VAHSGHKVENSAVPMISIQSGNADSAKENRVQVRREIPNRESQQCTVDAKSRPSRNQKMPR
jgi:hypothetical protein